MQTGYFKAAWTDLKESVGWFRKLLLLALLSFIPVFGVIVVNGYLYGWARDIAWGLRRPLPQRVFGNEDGKLYSRGFYAWVIALAFALVPLVIELVWSFATGFGFAPFLTHSGSALGAASALTMLSLSPLVSLAIMVLSFCASLAAMVGIMRMSIYHDIGAGFQLKKIWTMIRRDVGGLLRIIGMVLLVTIAVTAAVSIIVGILMVAIIFTGLFVALDGGSSLSINSAAWGSYLAIIIVVCLITLALVYITVVGVMFAQVLAVRAMGYWTRQFDVPMWHGKDDPLPFEIQQDPFGQPPYGGQPPYSG